MQILGISAYYHDSAAALIRDGEIIAAVQEERFSRKKHDARFPRNAAAYCLWEGGLRARLIPKTHTEFPNTRSSWTCGPRTRSSSWIT